MFKWLVLCALLVPVAGCVEINRVNETSFVPASDGTWKFKGYADAEYPLDTDAGEQARTTMLEKWLQENHLCAGGYTITDRQAVKKSSGLLADTYDVYYTGHCT
jgi:hypothetical protein